MEQTFGFDSVCSTISLTIALSNNRHEDFRSLERLVSNGRGVREGSTSPFITDTIGLRNSGQIFLQIALLFLVVFFICSLPSNVFAVPACPRPFELKQPSGKTFEARQHGDEWYNWVETKDGYGIYKNTDTGYWEYYVPSDETPRKEQKFRIGRKQDTKKRTIVSEVDPASLGIPKGLRPPRKEDGRPWKPTKPKISPQTTPHPSPLPQGAREHNNQRDAGANGRSPLPSENGLQKRLDETGDSPLERGAGGVFERNQKQPPESPFDKGDLSGFRTTESSTSTAVSGTMHLLVIGVDYDDTPATYTASEVQPLIFGSSNSVADYYNDVSYSAVTISPATESSGTSNDGFIGWLRLSGNHPNPGSSVGNEDAQIAKDAILAADSYIDFASYDTDGDGYVEPAELSIIVIVAGYERSYDSSGSPSVWAHHSDMYEVDYPKADGKTIQEYAMFGEKHKDHLATFGPIAHALGYLMFSLPNLYDTDHSSEGIGYFDLMSSGSWGAVYGENSGSSPTHLSAWSKEYLSWGTVNTISSDQNISLPKADGNKSSIFRVNSQDANQYFLLENRAFSGYDMGFQEGTGASGHGGLVIYHIDKTKTDLWPSSNTVNTDEYDKGVDVEEANERRLGYCALDFRNVTSDEFRDMFFFSGNNTSFTNTTTPNSNLKNSASTNISITGISAYGDTMTATVSISTQLPIVTTDSTTDVTSSSATLNGTVNANGLSTTAWFEYGKASRSYSSTTSTQTVSGTSDTAISSSLSGLTPYTTYYYRLVAQNSAGISYGGERIFTTLMDSTAEATPKIAAGGAHSLAIKSNSTVWAWGWNRTGQLGDRTWRNRNTPVQVSGLSGFIDVAGGEFGSLGLRSDGTVWTWGEDTVGWIRNTSIQVSNLSGIIAIACGALHNLALKSDGTVWAWGYNFRGELGDGTTTNRTTPFQVSDLSSVIEIAGGASFSLAAKSDGTVWAWGTNSFGALGDGTYTDRNTPVQVSGLTDVIAIAGGNIHSLALKSDGTVWAWGYNDFGQLGDETYAITNTPVQVSGLNGIIAIAVGSKHNLAIKSDGTVWAWGWNKYGQLGDETYTNRNTPVQVSGLSNVTAIACGVYHSIALKSDGTVWAWGTNAVGQLGDGTYTNRNTPIQLNINLGKASVDTIAPLGSIVINDGDPFANSTAITR